MRVDGRRVEGGFREWKRMPAYNFSSRYALNGKVRTVINVWTSAHCQLCLWRYVWTSLLDFEAFVLGLNICLCLICYSLVDIQWIILSWCLRVLQWIYKCISDGGLY